MFINKICYIIRIFFYYYSCCLELDLSFLFNLRFKFISFVIYILGNYSLSCIKD